MKVSIEQHNSTR